jgi:hypothetical protein
MITLEEALGIQQPKTSTNIKFNTSELIDIEQIKIYLKQGMKQRQIAEKLEHSEEVVSRKISKWMQTPDFNEWLDTWWLDLGVGLTQDTETQVEVFRQVTRLKVAQTTRKAEIKTEANIQVDISNQINSLIKFSSEVECKSNE